MPLQPDCSPARALLAALAAPPAPNHCGTFSCQSLRSAPAQGCRRLPVFTTTSSCGWIEVAYCLLAGRGSPAASRMPALPAPLGSAHRRSDQSLANQAASQQQPSLPAFGPPRGRALWSLSAPLTFVAEIPTLLAPTPSLRSRLGHSSSALAPGLAPSRRDAVAAVGSSLPFSAPRRSGCCPRAAFCCRCEAP